jgi:hypothetical protein
MGGVLISRLHVFRRCDKRVLRYSNIIQVNPTVVIGAKQAKMNLQFANLVSLAGCDFSNCELFKPRIVEGAVRIKIKIAGIARKRIDVRGQPALD